MNTPNTSILTPLLAQVFLTFVVWARLLYGRVTILQKRRIDPQVVASEAESKRIYASIENVSDNLENLFELPVLFYVASLIVLLTQSNNGLFLIEAWGFVGFRAVHSYIHCTQNRVLYRFYSYLASSACLWAMWLTIALQFYWNS